MKNIFELVPHAKFGHISGCQNPADLLTRGVNYDYFIANYNRWFNFPVNKFCCDARSDASEILKKSVLKSDSDVALDNHENGLSSINVVKSNEMSFPINVSKFSSFNKVIRVTAYVQKFIKIYKKKQ